MKKITTITTGTLFIIEHPSFIDRHVVARAAADASISMVSLNYYHPRDGWGEEKRNRKIAHIFSLLPDGADVAKISTEMEVERQRMESTVREARMGYVHALRGLAR